MLKSFKFRLYPNKDQIKTIETNLNSARHIYNLCLAERTTIHQQLKNNKQALYSHKYLTIKDYKTLYPYLKDADAHALRQAQMDLETSFKNYFRKLKTQPHLCLNGKSRPNFKTKYDPRKTYRTPQIIVNNHYSIRFKTNQDKSINYNSLKLPKLNFVKCKGYAPKHLTSINSATIIKQNNKYYCQLLCNVETPQKIVNAERSVVGIDIGIEKFLTLSNGTIIDSIILNNKPVKILTVLKNKQKKIKKLQKHLSRKKKHSIRRLNCKIKLANQYKKNSDFQSMLFYKITDKICCENQTVKIENLSLKGMMKLKKNKKFRVSKSFQLLSVNKFYNILKQKSIEYNTEIIAIDRFYPSSKLCSNCGNKKSSMNVSDRIYNCSNCNLSIDRDYNASINIKNYKSTKAVDYIHGETISPSVALQHTAISLK